MKDEQKGPQEEEYAFLQEVIKDETGGKKARKQKIFQTAGLAIIFGVVACLTFFALKPWIEPFFSEEAETVTIPEDEEIEDTEQVEEQPRVESVGYRQTLQSLKNISNEVEKSLVEVIPVDEKETWTIDNLQNQESVTGVIVADNGRELLILAEKTFEKKVQSFYVKIEEDSIYPATLKQIDGNLDLCVCAVSREDIPESTLQKIKIATLGNSNDLSEGDTVIVLGKPFGEDKARVYGLLASEHSSIEKADGIYKLLNTDIVGYDSGNGIIVNDKGEVVGIMNKTTESKGYERNITGYAISNIKRVIECMSNGAGVPYIGIYGVDLPDEMKKEGMSKGIYVKEVEVDSPAMAAGIQSGDIIVNVANNDIISYQGYYNILMNQKEESQIVLKGLRSGAGKEYVEMEFQVKIGSKE